LQAFWRSTENARAMRYQTNKMEQVLQEIAQHGSILLYDDIFHGSEYLAAVQHGDIKPSDTVLLLLVDGAQLYQNKVLDYWIYIWVILDIAPDKQYKKRYVIPGGFIPGPNKPKNLNSFFIP
jgi:hypothetical protein